MEQKGSIGDRIKEAMKAKSITVGDLAQSAGMSVGGILRLRSVEKIFRRTPKIDRVFKILGIELPLAAGGGTLLLHKSETKSAVRETTAPIGETVRPKHETPPASSDGSIPFRVSEALVIPFGSVGKNRFFTFDVEENRVVASF